MKFAVSNIAWPFESRLAVYNALSAHDFDGLEIAPGLFFFDAEDPFVPSAQDYKRAMSEIADAGFSLVSMQSLLFGIEGAALFEGDDALHRFEHGIARAIHLAGRLQIPNLVFGAPKQRIVPSGITQQEAADRAADVFRRLGDIAKSEGTQVSIEANPAVFGTNFLTHGQQALEFARMVAHPAVRFILDIGAMYTNDEFDETLALIENADGYLSHVHFSEPGLAPAPADTADAENVIKALTAAKYNAAVSIEMRATSDPVADVTAAIIRLKKARNAALDEVHLA